MKTPKDWREEFRRRMFDVYRKPGRVEELVEQIVREAVEEEREACALIADTVVVGNIPGVHTRRIAELIAKTIRTRTHAEEGE